MKEFLAIFRSRSQALDCINRLRAQRVRAQLINTPKEANVGCGLSVKFAPDAAGTVKRIISSGGYSAFYGYMAVENRQGRIYIPPRY